MSVSGFMSQGGSVGQRKGFRLGWGLQHRVCFDWPMFSAVGFEVW